MRPAKLTTRNFVLKIYNWNNQCVHISEWYSFSGAKGQIAFMFKGQSGRSMRPSCKIEIYHHGKIIANKEYAQMNLVDLRNFW